MEEVPSHVIVAIFAAVIGAAIITFGFIYQTQNSKAANTVIKSATDRQNSISDQKYANYDEVEYTGSGILRTIKLFQNEKLEDYKVNINKSNPLDKNCLSKKTMVLIAMLNYQYWCPNKKVKNDLYKQYLANNEKYEKQIQEKYNTDNLFKNKETEEIEVKKEIQALVEYKERNFIQRILDKIKSILKRK